MEEWAASEPPTNRQERSEPGHQGGARRWGRTRERKMRRAEGPTARAAWGWILLALGLWGILQVGAALVLKGSRVGGEVFAFDALCCDNSHALARHSGPRFCGRGRSKANNGMPVRVPAGELSILQLEQGIHFQAILCKKKQSTVKAVCGASWHSKLVEPLDPPA